MRTLSITFRSLSLCSHKYRTVPYAYAQCTHEFITSMLAQRKYKLLMRLNVSA
jgi:hypothetical protein